MTGAEKQAVSSSSGSRLNIWRDNSHKAHLYHWGVIVGLLVEYISTGLGQRFKLHGELFLRLHL